MKKKHFNIYLAYIELVVPSQHKQQQMKQFDLGPTQTSL